MTRHRVLLHVTEKWNKISHKTSSVCDIYKYKWRFRHQKLSGLQKRKSYSWHNFCHEFMHRHMFWTFSVHELLLLNYFNDRPMNCYCCNTQYYLLQNEYTKFTIRNFIQWEHSYQQALYKISFFRQCQIYFQVSTSQTMIVRKLETAGIYSKWYVQTYDWNKWKWQRSTQLNVYQDFSAECAE